MECTTRRLPLLRPGLLVLAACGVALAQGPSPPWPLAHATLQGAAVPGGGVLALDPLLSPATCARGGRLAFVSRIAASSHDQGVFVVDELGLRALARSSGAGGGSGVRGTRGDATPIGGTFAGLFEGTAFAPAISDHGDVLFVADVEGGASPRALFCADATTGSVRAVAAVGDPAPGGGAFASVGPGVHLPEGGVLFVARRDGLGDAELFSRRGATTAAFARIGDALPGGGQVMALSTESLSFVDGTSIPIGPLPSATACGDVAFCARGGGGAPATGIVVRSGGVDAWWARSGEAFAHGDAFVAFGAPLLARMRDGRLVCAFYADVLSPSGPTAAWFVGERGAWRRALGFFDAVDGGQCLGLAISRGAMTPLDDNGDLVVWCDLAIHGGQDRVVLCRPDGSLQVLMRRGDLAPGGGAIGELGGWPSLDGSGNCVVATRVAGGAVARAHCVLADPLSRLSVDPCARPGGSLLAVVHAVEPGAFLLAASPTRASIELAPFGLLEIGPEPLWLLSGLEPLAQPFARRCSFALPDDPQLAVALHLQGLVLLGSGARLTAADSARIAR